MTLEGRGLHLASLLVLARCRTLRVGAVGGLTVGADPLTAGVVALSGATGEPLRGFIVRREAKSHGTGRGVEGPPLEPGMRVALVDDVVTTGGAFAVSLERLAGSGVEVVEAIALVDRQEGGREALAERGLPLHALITRAELTASPTGS